MFPSQGPVLTGQWKIWRPGLWVSKWGKSEWPVQLQSSCEWVIVSQPWWTLCNPMDYSLPDTSVCGRLQARTLEWVAVPSPVHESEKWKWSRSVVWDSSRPHGLQPTRLLHPWDLPGKSTRVGCHRLLRNKPMGHKYWACALEPRSRSYWAHTHTATAGAHVLQSLCSATREATSVRSPSTTLESSPWSLELEKSLGSNKDPAQLKVNKQIKLKINKLQMDATHGLI